MEIIYKCNQDEAKNLGLVLDRESNTEKCKHVNLEWIEWEFWLKSKGIKHFNLERVENVHLEANIDNWI